MSDKKVKKAVIPAAGFGTRFLPATKSQPKEMLSVVDKPLIQYGVEEAVESGIEQIAIITSRGKSTMEDHFDKSPELEHFLTEKGKLEILKEVTDARKPQICKEIDDDVHLPQPTRGQLEGI